MAESNLTAQRLREVLHYDPLTGHFTWLVSLTNRIRVSDRAGTVNDKGYIVIAIDGRRYKAHRLAHLYMTGHWPLEDVDHRFGARGDNRWAELRDGTHAMNMQNQRDAPANSTSGLLGVTWNQRLGKWVAQIGLNGKTQHIGCYDDPKAAHRAYLDVKRQVHQFCTI